MCLFAECTHLQNISLSIFLCVSFTNDEINNILFKIDTKAINTSALFPPIFRISRI